MPQHQAILSHLLEIDQEKLDENMRRRLVTLIKIGNETDCDWRSIFRRQGQKFIDELINHHQK